MRRTPAARIASSTTEVAIVFCSRSTRGLVEPVPDVGVRGEVEDRVAALERALEARSPSSTSPSHELDAGALERARDELSPAGADRLS